MYCVVETDCYVFEDSGLDNHDCTGLDELEIECMASQIGHNHTGCLGCSGCLLILTSVVVLSVLPLLLILVI